MTLVANLTTDSDARFALLFEEIVEKLQSEEDFDVEACLRKHPEYADRLRRLLPAVAMLAEVGRSAARGQSAGVTAAGSPGLEVGVLGDYRIVREVGRGGMGVVYEAEQVSLGRRVALKVLPFAATMDPRQLQRFHNEARAAAGLHHTNIVPVYGVGQERGIHYYAMQFIDGQTLAALIDQQRQVAFGQVPTTAEAQPAGPSASTVAPAAQATSGAPRDRAYFRQSAEWGIQAAEALDCAHSLGVVHRDVKPANLLIDAGGRQWVTDFGLAQVQSDARLTLSGDLVGTLRYMSPEQALAKRVVIDHRSDVYSLGATLYELLTLQPVFEGSDRQELLRQIAFEDPKPPRRTNKTIPTDLETIVVKALEKNPADRYATAQELADDLGRFLADQSIGARRPALLQRIRKWARRHQAFVNAGIAILVLATAGLSVGAALIWQEKQETENALVAKTQALKDKGQALWEKTQALQDKTHAFQEKDRAFNREQLALYRARIILANRELGAGNYDQVQKLLDACPNELRQWEWQYLARVCERSHQAPRLTLLKADVATNCLAVSPNGQIIAAGRRDNTVKLWDARTSQELPIYGEPTKDAGVIRVAFSTDGRRLAAASGDGTVRLWDTQSKVPPLTLRAPKGGFRTLAISPNGQRLVAGGNVWNLETSDLVFTLGNSHMIDGAAFSPDSRRIATAAQDKLVKVWDIASGKELLSLQGHTARVQSLAFSPDGKHLASASSDKTVRVWDAASGEAIISLTHPGGVWWVIFQADDKRLASASGTMVKLWDLRRGQEIRSSKVNAPGQMMVVSPDASWVAKSIGATLKVWDVTSSPEAVTTAAHGVIFELSFSPNGRHIAAACADGAARLFEATTGHELLTLEQGVERGRVGSVFGVAFSPNGRLLASAGSNHTVKLWDLSTGRELLSLRGHTRGVNRAAFSPDGKLVASASLDETVKLWDTHTGQVVHTFKGHRDPVYGVAFNPDGKRLVSASGEYRGQVILWDVKEGRESLRPAPEPGAIQSVSFSSDGRRILAPVAGHGVKVWDATTGKEIPDLRNDGFMGLSPDGKRLVSRGSDNAVQVCDAMTGEVILTLRGHTGTIMTSVFSPDGKRLASGDILGMIRIWDATPLAEK